MPFAPDVVLSFSHADREVVEDLARRLSAAGLKVRWDEPIIAPDEHREKTAAAIRATRAVIVLWTRHALANRWVVEEADEALRLGKLVSIGGQGIAQNDLPEPSRRQQLIRLVDGVQLAQVLRAMGLDLANDLPGSAPAPKLEGTAPRPEKVAADAAIEPAPEPSELDGRAAGAVPAISEPVDLPEAAEATAPAMIARPQLKLRRRLSAPAGHTPAFGVAAAVAAVMVVAVLVLSSGLLQALTN